MPKAAILIVSSVAGLCCSLAKMQQACVREPSALSGASVLRRDVSRDKVPIARERVRNPRIDSSEQRPIQSLGEARDWERVFIGEIKAGRDPRRPRVVCKSSGSAPQDVASFLAAYVERCVRPAALKSMKSISSRIAVLQQHLGELPIDALEEPDEINRFKTDSDYAEQVELATIHRTLETLRHAMKWGMAADAVLQEIAVPPLRCADEQEGGDDAGTTSGTKAPAGCSPTASTSASFS